MTRPLPTLTDIRRLARRARDGALTEVLEDLDRWPASERLNRLVLRQAVRGGQADLIQTMGGRLRHRRQRQRTIDRALLLAARTNQAASVSALLTLGANPRTDDSRAVVIAAEGGHLAVIRLLLPLVLHNGGPGAALASAIRMGQITAVDLILDTPGFSYRPWYRASTRPALVLAAEAGQLALVEHLLQRPDRGKLPPEWELDGVGYYAFLAACEQGHAPIAQALFPHLDAKILANSDALCQAAQSAIAAGFAALAHRLLEIEQENGGTVSTDALSGMVKAALRAHHEDLAKQFFTQYQGDRPEPRLHWDTLHGALETGHLDWAQEVFDQGHWRAGKPPRPDTFAPNDQETPQSILAAAARARHEPIVRRLLQKPPTRSRVWEALGFAAQAGHAAMVALLLTQWDPHVENDEILGVMCKAGEGGHDTVLTALTPFADSQDWEQALIEAAKAGHTDLVLRHAHRLAPSTLSLVAGLALRHGHRDLMDRLWSRLDLKRSPGLLQALIESDAAAPWKSHLAAFDVRAEDSKALTVAVQHRRWDWVHTLMPLSDCNAQHAQAFLDLVKADRLEEVRAMLPQVDVSAHGAAALAIALEGPSVAMIALLAEHGQVDRDLSKQVALVAKQIGHRQHYPPESPTWSVEEVLALLIPHARADDAGDWLAHWASWASWIGLDALTPYTSPAAQARWITLAPEDALPRMRTQVRAQALADRPASAPSQRRRA